MSKHFHASAGLKSLLILSSLGITLSTLSESRLYGQSGSKEASAVDARSNSAAAVRQSQGEEPAKTKFLRLKKETGGQPVSLQTALTRYKPAQGDVVVDLIGAVHIGEGDYYAKLNKQFELYDVVLYELVAPQGTRIPTGGRTDSSNPLSMLQGSMQSMLGLESQLHKVDYQKKNFVHADMSPSEMAAKMKERGDTAITVGLSALTEILRQQNKAGSALQGGALEPDASELMEQLNNASLFELLGDPLKMKQLMAVQFTQSGAMDLGLGQTLNRMLIDDRNSAAVKVLNKELAKGKKKIAIFYGAAHMPDFEKRLAELGLKKTDQVWVDAWDLTKSHSKKNDPTRMLFKMLNEWSK